MAMQGEQGRDKREREGEGVGWQGLARALGGWDTGWMEARVRCIEGGGTRAECEEGGDGMWVVVVAEGGGRV